MGLLKILLIVLLLAFPIAELGKVQLGIISFTLNDILVTIVLLVWITYNRKNVFKRKLLLIKPVAIFTLIAFVSLIINLSWLNQYEFMVSALYLGRWVLYASLYLVIASLDRKFLEKLKLALVIPITVFILLGYVQFYFYSNLRNLYYLGWDEHLYRLFSTFLDPNFAGSFFVLTFIYLLYLILLYSKRTKFIIPLATLASFNLFAIYLTYSRSALIMLLTSLLIFLVLLNKKKLLFASIIVLLSLIFVSPKAFQTEGTNIFRIASSEARIDSARVAIDIFSKNPILGTGFNSYRFAQHKYGYLQGESWKTTHSGAGTDNSYLFIMATTGLLGLASYIYLIYRLLYISKAKNTLMSKVLVASLAGVLINSLFINSLFYVYIMEWIWILSAFTENS